MSILLVCADEQRLNRLKDAITQQLPNRFGKCSRSGVDANESFDIGAVVIDHELKNDIAASAFRQRFITLNLNENAAPEAVVMELTNLFSRGSERVQ